MNVRGLNKYNKCIYNTHYGELKGKSIIIYF